MEVNDRIDKLGRYFVYFNIRERFGISFERFIVMVDCGSWECFIKSVK